MALATADRTAIVDEHTTTSTTLPPPPPTTLKAITNVTKLISQPNGKVALYTDQLLRRKLLVDITTPSGQQHSQDM